MFLGGTLGAATVLAFLWWRPGRFTIVALSVMTSLLLGALYASVRDSAGLGAFLGFGFLATAASFILVAHECRDVPANVSEGLALLRKVTGLMVFQAALCTSFAAVGFLSIHSVIVLYQKM